MPEVKEDSGSDPSISKSDDDTIPVKSELKQQADSDKPRCPNCDETSFSEDSSKGELYCTNCGSIVDEDRIDFSEEWRAFDAEEKSKKSRSGGSITFTKSDKGMKTKIGSSGELNNVKGSKRQQYYRMKKWDNRTSNSKERLLQRGLSEMKKLVSQLGLPDSVSEEAARLLEKSREEGIVKGRNLEVLVAALTFLVARNQGTPRTLDEFAEAISTKKRKLGKTYRYAARELDIPIQPAKPEDFVPRFGEQLGFNGREQAHAKRIIDEAREEGLLAGKSPKSVVAGVFYIVSSLEDKELTQKEIAEKVGVTEVTVRKNYSDIAEKLDIDMS
ncbi:MAG: transcription initiation factor IIB family protein [Candidatus Nanohalobium sp.]